MTVEIGHFDSEVGLLEHGLNEDSFRFITPLNGRADIPYCRYAYIPNCSKSDYRVFDLAPKNGLNEATVSRL